MWMASVGLVSGCTAAPNCSSAAGTAVGSSFGVRQSWALWPSSPHVWRLPLRCLLLPLPLPVATGVSPVSYSSFLLSLNAG